MSARVEDGALIFECSDAEFQEKILNKRDKVLYVVDFWAPWCQPCLVLGKVIEQVMSTRTDKMVQVCKINVDKFQEVAARYRVSSIPVLLFFIDGEQKGNNSVGSMPKEAFTKLIHKYLGADA